MKDVLSQTDASSWEHRPYSAQWYQAAMIPERVPCLLQESAVSLSNQERAKRRLEQWKNQPPFQKLKQLFTQRLALDGLTEESLLTLFAQPAEAIQASFSTPPIWLVELLHTFDQQASSVLAALPCQKLGDEQADAVFQAMKPLLASGFARLQRGIRECQHRFPRLPFDPKTIGILLLPHLFEQLLSRLTKTLVLELNIARLEGKLQGETSEQRFTYFLQQLAQPEKILALLEEYPVLARYLVEQIERWVTCEVELLQRLCADWDEICSVFAQTGDPGSLTEIQEEAGDVHQGGRSVTILTWSSGLRLVYKPRSLAVDAHFQELLTWLNTLGCQPAFHMFKLIQKETYGWCEFVSARECSSQEEIERFYQRLGGYLALLYALEATDFHAENLLAAGEDPMLIDLESLFQPRTESSSGSASYLHSLFTYSVRRVGLLPQRLWSREANAGIDISGLVGQAGQLTPFPVLTLKDQGTDQMRMAREHIEIQFGDHRPTLQGMDVDTLEHEKSLITGFTTVYRLLLQHRDELLTTILPRFADDEIRVLLRPTQTYVILQADSFHPNALRDALNRERIFDRLWIGIEHSPHLTRVIAAERADLADDDIPKFTTHPDSRNLLTSKGEIVTEFFRESSLDMAKKCIQHLSEQDLERQIWIIQASFASLTLNSAHTLPQRNLKLLPAQSRVTREQLIKEAMAIGNRLHRLALIQQDMVGWLILNVVSEQEWRPVPAGPDFYSGMPGIAFFLAYLGKLSGEERYTTLARQTLQTMQVLLAPRKQPWSWNKIGAFDGASSLIYLLAHLGTIWHEPALYQEAEEIVVHLPGFISQDKTFDMMSGAAGCIAALLSLYTVAPSESTLATALQCGDHLLSHARPMPQGIGWSPVPEQTPLVGLSHGNAGIALNLLRLAAVSQEERFRQAAFAAIAYERSLFSPEKRNWPDLRNHSIPTGTNNPQTGDTPDRSYMTAWCHGCVGIGLARLASLGYHDDRATREEVEAAIQTTLAEGFGKNHSLCHGDMGSLEFLLTATQMLPELYSREKLEPLQASLLESMKTHGWRSGVPLAVETPSLMIGIAGTGYALLRQTDPEHVPSLLLLAPPACD